MLEGIELIVFDMDGILVDSKQAVWYAFQKGLADIGVKVTRKQLDENIKGRGIKIDITDLIPTKNSTVKRALIDEATESIERAKISNKAISLLKGYPDTRKVLKTLRETGFLMAVLSNSHRIFVEATLYKLKLVGFWDKVIAKDDDLETKEDALKSLIKDFGVTKRQTVYIGDMELDIKAARNVGCKIIFKPGWQGYEPIKNSKPDYVIESLKGLI